MVNIIKEAFDIQVYGKIVIVGVALSSRYRIMTASIWTITIGTVVK